MILLDTHVLVWLIEGDERLGKAARERIEDARAGEGACISAITPWEISMLYIKGRVQLSRPVRKWIGFALAAPGMELQAIDPMLAVDAGQLPDDLRGDPADRLIVATARHLKCPLVTADRPIQRFAEKGNLSVIDASR